MSVSLANSALRRIHAHPVNSLDAADHKRRVIVDEFVAAVAYVIRRHGFSELTSVYCPKETDASDCDLPFGFCNAFVLPKNYSRIRRVDAGVAKDCVTDVNVQWRILKVKGCSVIVTNCAPVTVEYVCIPELNELDGLNADLQDAIRLRLAMQLVQPLNADKSMYAEIHGEFEQAMALAQTSSEEEDQQDHVLDEPGELLEARLSGWGYRG